MSKYKSSPLQWAGSKQKALKEILPIITGFNFEVFIEPFIGAANVSLNVEAQEYIWNDFNKDLINTYGLLSKTSVSSYIKGCEELFESGFTNYYEIREAFNKETLSLKRAIYFQYLNKHGFNGLCRYNSKGVYNVPIGTITKNPKQVPYEGISNVSTLMSTKDVKLLNYDFCSLFNLVDDIANKEVLVYSDPPYVPLTSNFKYTANDFKECDHIELKKLSKESPHNCLISNHWTDFTKELYSDADEVHTFEVQRTISCDGGNRKKVEECLVVYYGE